MIGLVLNIGALVCFGIAATGVPVPRVNFVALGLFFVTLAHTVPVAG